MFWQKGFDTFAARLREHSIPLRVRLWNGKEYELGHSPSVTITVPTVAGMRPLLAPSLDTLGHAYVENKIDVEGPVTAMLEVATRMAEEFAGSAEASRRKLRLARHSKSRDAGAIAYHYDVSNDFYRLWLDRNMVYSCAYFHHPDDSLEAAQEQKIDHILRKLKLREGDRLLDIGCGWGALVMRAAERYGVRALGITLSQNQYELANARIREAGLQDRCEVRIEDYRDVAGKFDRIASVGMFEHVGLNNLGAYFAKVRQLLDDDGMALIHGINSSDIDSRETPWGAGQFINRYVFPNGELAHLSLVLQEMCAAGLEPVDIENLRRHYAMTLMHWSRRFEAASERLREMVDEKCYRIWRVYLAGCAHAFESNWITVNQILVVNGGGNAIPLTRDYIYR